MKREPWLELELLCNGLAEGELDAHEIQRIESLVLADDEAAEFYVKFFNLHHSLSDLLFEEECGPYDDLISEEVSQSPSSVDNSGDLLPPLCDIPIDLLDPPPESKDPEETSGNWLGGLFGNFGLTNYVPVAISLVSLVLVVGGIVVVPFYWARNAADSWTVVGRVTKTIGCRWVSDETCSREGSLLTAGQPIELEAGLAEIEFAGGAKVIVQGPAHFVASNPKASRLDYGQLSATVPEGAEGFAVQTPSMNVVDLGTEFGVAVTTPDRADLHVFKGLVEMEAKPDAGNREKIRLKKNEAVEYSKKSGDVVHVPIDTKKFVRDLDRNDGITANLKVTNAGFESPDIRTVSEFQSKLGTTLFRPIYGWKMSDRNQITSRVAMYQISPYQSAIQGNDVGPGATEGRQVATISLGVKGVPVGKPRSGWLYQSLGRVAPKDVGKTLKLTVDAGPRNTYAGLPAGDGTVFAGFALQVNLNQSGTILGTPGTFHREGAYEALQPLEATVSITVEMVGQEMFILLFVGDNGTSRNIDQYHFDNVQLFQVGQGSP